MKVGDLLTLRGSEDIMIIACISKTKKTWHRTVVLYGKNKLLFFPWITLKDSVSIVSSLKYNA